MVNMARVEKPFALEGFLSSVDAGQRQLRHKSGEAIFNQGEPCDAAASEILLSLRGLANPIRPCFRQVPP